MSTKTTKQLARELGLLRKRCVSAPSPRLCRKRQKTTAQVFSYLIVIDFESTCWEDDRTSPQEIIEFPAVLLNSNTGAIESEFHYYLQPSERPTLSDFCRQLTGITQDQVDDGIPLSLCLRKFAGWIRKLREEKDIVCADEKNSSKSDTSNGKVAAIMTWSDWDLGVCLLSEARRKQITRPPCLDRWIDLRATYKKFYSRRPDGLNGALKDLGIEFDGREHSGLDDARNTAKLAWRMMCDGCIMTITKALKTNQTGKIERVSFLPLSPKSFNKQPHILDTSSTSRKSIGKNDTLTLATCHNRNSRNESPKTKTPFSIPYDKDSLASKETTPSHGVKKGLTERDTNLPSPYGGRSTSHKSPYHQDLNKKVSDSCLSKCEMTEKCLATMTLDGKNKQEMDRKEFSRIPLLKSDWKKCTELTNTCQNHSNASVHSESQTIFTRSSPMTTASNHLPSPVTVCSPRTSKKQVKSSSASFETGSKCGVSQTVRIERSTTASFKSPEGVAVCQLKKKIMPSSSSISPNVSSVNAAQHDLLSEEYIPAPGHRVIQMSSNLSEHITNTCNTNNKKETNQTPSHTSFRSTSSMFKTPTLWDKTTPSRTVQQTLHTSYITPTMLNKSSLSNMKVTPPLCSCGRRSKRRLVQNQGPNTGRWFFTCANSYPSDHNKSKTGCKFFQWESPCIDGKLRCTSGNIFTPINSNPIRGNIPKSLGHSKHLCSNQSLSKNLR